MLINPCLPTSRELLTTISGTNIIKETLSVVGVTIADPETPDRRWTISSLYAPVRGRAIGGLRAKLFDQKDFISFCNQRDLEVLLELAKPGNYCPWLDREYVAPGDREWLGLCTDEQDLIDDLYDRELEARALYDEHALLPEGLQFTRRVHASHGNDFEELLVLRADDGDLSIGTVTRRWASVERTATREREKLWLRL